MYVPGGLVAITALDTICLGIKARHKTKQLFIF